MGVIEKYDIYFRFITTLTTYNQHAHMQLAFQSLMSPSTVNMACSKLRLQLLATRASYSQFQYRRWRCTATLTDGGSRVLADSSVCVWLTGCVNVWRNSFICCILSLSAIENIFFSRVASCRSDTDCCSVTPTARAYILLFFDDVETSVYVLADVDFVSCCGLLDFIDSSSSSFQDSN